MSECSSFVNAPAVFFPFKLTYSSRNSHLFHSLKFPLQLSSVLSDHPRFELNLGLIAIQRAVWICDHKGNLQEDAHAFFAAVLFGSTPNPQATQSQKCYHPCIFQSIFSLCRRLGGQDDNKNIYTSPDATQLR